MLLLKSLYVEIIVQNENVYAVTVKAVDADIDEDLVSRLERARHRIAINGNHFYVVSWAATEDRASLFV
ncbi:hypothetical protein CSC03_1025 [Enterobacter hormaechei]|nr:hypothetical protein CSC03_1025 [Enterobacter hormaechei]